jgi:hypothetical protein
MPSQFPLSKVTIGQLQRLVQLLWSWDICSDCLVNKPCSTEVCPWLRSTILSRYFEFYKEQTASYECDIRNGQKPGLSSHEDLFSIVQRLISNPEITRAELLEVQFADRPARSDQERAVNLAVKVMMMVNCSASRKSSALLEHGNYQTSWRSNVSFCQFISDAFPKTDHPSVDVIRDNLRARKLKKVAGLTFQSTDDLRRHLKLDRKAAVVEVFHHTAFLKENLRRTKDEPRHISVSECINL